MDDRFDSDLPGDSDQSLTDPTQFPSSNDSHQIPFNPFLAIWTKPRDTIRRILETNPEKHVTLLVCLYGIWSTLDKAVNRSAGDNLSLPTILAIACILGPLGGIFSAWMFSHLNRISGKWLGGAAEYSELKAAFAWSTVPILVGLILMGFQILMIGNETFSSGPLPDHIGAEVAVTLLVLAICQICLGIWSLVLMCNTIAEVQGYRSAWKGLANLFLAGLIVIVPIAIIGLLVALFVLSAAA